MKRRKIMKLVINKSRTCQKLGQDLSQAILVDEAIPWQTPSVVIAWFTSHEELITILSQAPSHEWFFKKGKTYGDRQTERAVLPTIAEAIKGTHLSAHRYLWTPQLSGPGRQSTSSTRLLTEANP
jgi:hypothetical protein